MQISPRETFFKPVLHQRGVFGLYQGRKVEFSRVCGLWYAVLRRKEVGQENLV